MGKVVVFELGDGDFEQGFSVTMQIGEEGKSPSVELRGKLPPNQDILPSYERWHTAYLLLESRYRLSAKEDEVTTRGSFLADCARTSTELETRLDEWLNVDSLRPLRERFLAKVRESEDVRVLIQTNNLKLHRLPWHLWSLFNAYPRAEVAAIPADFDPIIIKPSVKPKTRILAILGDSTGIDTQADALLLKRLLPKAEICFLPQPDMQTLTEKLWEQQGWDILFFAGHSSSRMEGDNAWIQINPHDRLTLRELKRSLSTAIANGLKLAIFNSCDGLGLAKTLADLQIPQVIVMREEVPDKVANAFLRYFLEAFVRGEPLYYAVKEARSKLEGLEREYPCATWLPVIYQNSPDAPLTWKKGFQRHRDRPLKLPIALTTSLIIGGLVAGTRLLGLWQGLDLQAYDQLLRMRPADGLDPRIFVVRITQDDLDSENRTALTNQTWFALLNKLKQAKMIGLDIYRNSLQGEEQKRWTEFLQKNPQLNVYGICERPHPLRQNGEKLSPGLDQNDKFGFSNVSDDWQFDRIVRRQVMQMSLHPSVTANLQKHLAACPTEYAFSFAMAIDYWQAVANQPPAKVVGQEFEWSGIQFKHVKPRYGAYQNLKPGGYEIMLNYRFPLEVGDSATVREVLSDYAPETFKDKIVLIGVDNFGEDRAFTPYQRDIAGVFIHAQMLSYLLDLMERKRPLIWVWSPATEVVWILGWSIAAGLLIWCWRSPLFLGVSGGVLLGVLYGGCFLLLQNYGGWIPLLPPAVAFTLTLGSLTIYTATRSKQN